MQEIYTLTPHMHKDKRGRRNPARPDIHLTAVARRLGISTSYLSRLLNGYIEHPGLELSLILAPELGVPVEELPKLLRSFRKQREDREERERLDEIAV